MLWGHKGLPGRLVQGHHQHSLQMVRPMKVRRCCCTSPRMIGSLDARGVFFFFLSLSLFPSLKICFFFFFSLYVNARNQIRRDNSESDPWHGASRLFTRVAVRYKPSACRHSVRFPAATEEREPW